MKDYGHMAAALYDGGWRSEDREDLASEYDLNEHDLDEICAFLIDYATRA